MKDNEKNLRVIKYMETFIEVVMENDIVEIGAKKATKKFIDKLNKKGLADNKEEAKQLVDNYFNE